MKNGKPDCRNIAVRTIEGGTLPSRNYAGKIRASLRMATLEKLLVPYAFFIEILELSRRIITFFKSPVFILVVNSPELLRGIIGIGVQ